MSFTVDASELEEIVVPHKMKRGLDRMSLAIAKTLTDIETGAKERSRVDSGNMRNAWTNTGVIKVGLSMHGEVYNPVDYTVHNEFGTWKMAAQPMAIPALDQAAPGFIAAIAEAAGDLL